MTVSKEMIIEAINNPIKYEKIYNETKSIYEYTRTIRSFHILEDIIRNEFTLDTIGKIFKISRQRVQQIHKRQMDDVLPRIAKILSKKFLEEK